MSDKQDFADLKFRIECSQIVLTQANGTPLAVRGPGEIWQDTEGVLQFKIFTNEEGYRAVQNYARRPGVVGQLIPDEEFFNLFARDYQMPEWTAQRIVPSYRGGFSDGLAHGYIHELVRSEAIPVNCENDFVVLRLKGKIQFPCNQGTETEIRMGGHLHHTGSSLNAAFIEDGEYRFELYHEREHTVITLQLPAGRLTPATPSRIQEALQFVLGQQTAVMGIETGSGGRHITRLTSPNMGHGEIMPPLKFSRTDFGDNVWRIFSNYFRYIHLNTEPEWHPISRHVSSAIESSVASLEVSVLALAVAVEGLAGECFPNLAPVDPAFLAELDVVQTALQGVKLGEQGRNRINGSIRAMRPPRKSDIIRAFIANNRLENGLFNSWSRLRNTSAHGGGMAGRDAETTLRLRSEVLSLFYSLIFAAINYSGTRTEYSQRGWPTQSWPVPHPSGATLTAPNDRTANTTSNI